MPAALNVNREAVRVLVLSIGVREAARQMGLPQSTVQSWSQRGKWLEPARNPPALPPTVLAASNPATSATTAPDAMANKLAEDSEATRKGFSTAARKVAEKVATLKPSMDKDRAQAVRHWAGVASTVHGWEAKAEGGGRVMINIGILNE